MGCRREVSASGIIRPIPARLSVRGVPDPAESSPAEEAGDTSGIGIPWGEFVVSLPRRQLTSHPPPYPAPGWASEETFTWRGDRLRPRGDRPRSAHLGPRLTTTKALKKGSASKAPRAGRSAGRSLSWHGRGRGFKSHPVHFSLGPYRPIACYRNP
jgi:hypothetical protein